MGNFYMEATQINYRRDDTLKTVDQKLQELSQESAIDTDIAPVFKSTSTYNPGDLVYYRNKLYVCNTQHSGAWAAADFTATDVSTALNAAVGALDETKADYADLAGAFSAETAYTAGDLVIYNGIIYRCTNDHTGEWDADDFSATTIGAELNSISSNLSGYELQNNTNLEVADRKNILPVRLSNVKAKNTTGTWSDNIYTVNGGTITVNTNNDGYVTEIVTNGTFATNTTFFNLVDNFSPKVSGDYVLNGIVAQAEQEVLQLYFHNDTDYIDVNPRDKGLGATVTLNSAKKYSCYFRVSAGSPIDNEQSYPMLRDARVSDATFAPYIPSVETRLESVENDLTSKSLYIGKSTIGFWNSIFAGHYSGSGNYISFFIPCKYDTSISSVSIDNNAKFSVYRFDGTSLNQAYYDVTNVTVYKSSVGLKIEIKTNETHTNYINTVMTIELGQYSDFTFS